jgi:molybdopterin/thiamine biosynthesis adenylyltransferase
MLGDGSPLIAQLARLRIGRIILIDMDQMEWKDIGRIYFSTAVDANLERLKVDMLAEAIGRVGLGTEVIRLAMDIATPKAARAVASAELVFVGLDSMAGREMLNRIATFYNLPYIDMVRLQVSRGGGINLITRAITREGDLTD